MSVITKAQSLQWGRILADDNHQPSHLSSNWHVLKRYDVLNGVTFSNFSSILTSGH